jgi:predicted amidohydrolase
VNNELKIALLQLTPEATTALALKRGLAACEEAAQQGADIALFPEMWSNGYAGFDLHDRRAAEAWVAGAVRPESEFVRTFQDAARRLHMAIGITFLEAVSGQRPRNSLYLFDRNGAFVLRYSKVHVVEHGTEAYCTPGEGFGVATLQTARGPVQVGAMICFDREFPESARVLSVLGAELVLVPNACLFDDHRMTQMKTRAFEDKVALVMTNYPETHVEGNGRSLAISPVAWERISGSPRMKYRETLLLQTGPAPGIYYCSFDLEAIREYRRNSIWGNTFRHPEAYGPLLDPKLVPPPLVENDALIH